MEIIGKGTMLMGSTSSYLYHDRSVWQLVAVGHKNMGAMEWIFMAAGPIL